MNHPVYLHSHGKLLYFIVALSDALSFNGINNEIKETVSDNLNDNLWIGIWNRLNSYNLPRRFIAYNAETLRYGKWHESMPEYMTKALDIWDYSHSHIKLLKEWGYSSHFVPMAYSPYYENLFKTNVPVVPDEKDIDVLFYGSMSRRRRLLIKLLQRSKLRVQWLSQNVGCDYGQYRDQLISRSKIVVSCHKLADGASYQTNDMSRLSYLIANKIFTVSEPWGDIFVESKWDNHIVMKSFDELVETCIHYVGKDLERKRIVDDAYSYAVEKFNLRDMIPVDYVKYLIQS